MKMHLVKQSDSHVKYGSQPEGSFYSQDLFRVYVTVLWTDVSFRLFEPHQADCFDGNENRE